MAISPTDSSDVFIREVDDALREDQLKSFWDRYGKLLLGVITAGLIGYGGYLYYNHSKAQDAGVTSETYYRGMDAADANNFAAADKEFAAVVKEGDPAYRSAGLMAQASTAMQQNNVAKAAEIYGQVATDTKVLQVYRDVALVRQMTLLFDKEKPETIIARVSPIAKPDNAMYGSAAELIALANMKLGKDAEAAKIYGEIAANESVPDGLKTRAQQMAGMLGVAVPENADSNAAKDGADKTAPAAPKTPEGGEKK